MNWIQQDLTLEGERVVLRPMMPEHIDGLLAAGADTKIWTYLPVKPDLPSMRAFYMEAFANRDKGVHFPFTIFDKKGSIIGTTRFGDIEPEHKKLEIGWTWYLPELWGKGYNEECKYLLLSYCFDVLKTVRVQLKTNERNYRSRRAIARLGCKFEGIYRNHVIREGIMRNTAMFSILPEEWEQSKAGLKAVFEAKYAGDYHYDADAINVPYQEYTITTDKTRMQPERIHQWLSTQSYWLPGVAYDTVLTAFNSCFCIAVLQDGRQIGYARLVTDYVIFGYLADVYIEEEHRGKGLAKKMIGTLLELDWVQQLKKLVLVTRDAHTLYAQLGYTPLVAPDRYMERNRVASN